jgi:sporulation protein YlmC with PRC-barrel domain
MNTYAILRRSGWKSTAELDEAAQRSRAVGDEQMSDDIRAVRFYVLEEDDGSIGSLCIYQASSPEAIREHASRANLPVDEIIPVADTVVVRPDPESAGAQTSVGASAD